MTIFKVGCSNVFGSDNACPFWVIFPKVHITDLLTTPNQTNCITLCTGNLSRVVGAEYIMPPGSAMIIPKYVVHWMRNDWEEHFEVIGIYPEVPNFYLTGQQVPADWEKYGFTPHPKAN